MADTTDLLFQQPFTAASQVLVTHNLNLPDLGVQVIVGTQARRDLVTSVEPTKGNPNNEFTVFFAAPQSGTVQVYCRQMTPVYQAPTFSERVTQPEYVISLDNTIGAQNIGWSFTMGSEIRVAPPAAGGTITKLAVKLGAGALTQNPHAWALRKSTFVGPAFPALSTYTTIIDSGTHVFVAANVWEVLTTVALPVSVAVDEWYILQIWIGGGGQFSSISTLRSVGLLNEAFATLEGGTFVSQLGPAPGATPVPASRSITTVYGLTSIEITPP